MSVKYVLSIADLRLTAVWEKQSVHAGWKSLNLTDLTGLEEASSCCTFCRILKCEVNLMRLISLVNVSHKLVTNFEKVQ